MKNIFSVNACALRAAAIIFISLFLLTDSTPAQYSQTKKTTLRRAQSFFGMHFDFHAGRDCNEIGKNVTEASITDILRSVKPDFIQIDCKGHPGLSSYPTKVGNRAPGFIGDPLKRWRAATAREHVALYMHYSGVFDQQAIKNDSSVARVNADGSRDHDMTSVFSPYVDQIMIPQLNELNDVYHVDGVWVDGDCWATGIDYSKKAVEAFTRATQRTTVSKTPDDAGYEELRQFSRKAFQNYMKHYVDAIHAHNPKFQIASNWAYSSFMPEPVAVNVNFLSGDYNYVGSLNSARWEGRYLQNQGKPWDLMSWGFFPKGGAQQPKSELQLQQEASVVISLGGGFQAYFTQNRDGSVAPWKVRPMVGVGKFIRARQRYCQYAAPIPQIALFYSREDFYRRIPKLFGSWDTGEYAKGLLFALLDAQQCVQVLSEHHLKGKMNKYPLIVLPDVRVMEPGIKKELLAYAKNGGALLVTGMHSAEFFKDDARIRMGRDTLPSNAFYLRFNGDSSSLVSVYKEVSLPDDAVPMGDLVAASSARLPRYHAGAIIPYGKGKIGFIFADFGSYYGRSGGSAMLRNYLNNIVAALFPHPVVNVTGSHQIDVTLNRSGKRTVINLVNTGRRPNSGNVDLYDEIPPLTNIQVSVRAVKKPSRITLVPENTNVKFDFKNGLATFVIPRITVHSLVVIN